MDPFTIALATFGIQKLRGKSTKRSLRDAAIAGGLGQFAGMAGLGQGTMGRFAPQAFGSTSLPGMTGNFIGQTTGSAGQVINMPFSQQLTANPIGSGIQKLIGDPTQTNKVTGDIIKEGSGFRGLSPGAQLGIGAAATTALAGDDDPAEMPEGTKPEDYKEAKERADKQLEGIIEGYDYSNYQDDDASPYDYSNEKLFTFSKGGIAEVKKFNKGGINYLPSMTDHDKNDVNNYVRAMGYVEDGSGNGDKDEDTMLAQLADGEFVSRADAILGAGIMEGANPKSFKDMRKKGAAFFYGQQAKFKRIFDLLDEAKEKAN
jgi:hypothetical protein